MNKIDIKNMKVGEIHVTELSITYKTLCGFGMQSNFITKLEKNLQESKDVVLVGGLEGIQSVPISEFWRTSLEEWKSRLLASTSMGAVEIIRKEILRRKLDQYL